MATTYTLHAGFFENELLTRFLGLRFDGTERERSFVVEREAALGRVRVSLLVEARHVDGSQSTLRWDQLPVAVDGGVQHAKLTLLQWRRCLRLIVGSGNITRQGYRRNRESVSVIDFFDTEESPPRQLALDAIAFLKDIEASGWVRAAEQARARLHEALNGMRSALDAWQSTPSDFTPREIPRATFVPGLPARPGRQVRSPLKTLIDLWGTNRRAAEVTVMTPFVGESARGQRKVIDALMAISRPSDAVNELVVPGVPSEEDPSSTVINLPRWFRDVWADAWNQHPDEIRTWVVPIVREADGEKVQRDLHAKSIILSDGSRAAALVGSSNFSPHGMCIGAANIEANLCLVSDDPQALRRGLPIRPEDLAAAPPTWLEAPQIPEVPGPGGTLVPAVFVSATSDQRAGVILLRFDPSKTLPPEWSIAIPGPTHQGTVLAGHKTLPQVPEHAYWSCEVPSLKAGLTVAVLRVNWVADAAAEPLTAFLAVQTVSAEALVPPEEFRSLSADAIMACILSGKDPSELVDGGDEAPGKNGSPDHLDPLRYIDTSTYPIYRSRRLGRVLGTLGNRLVRTLPTTTAVSYALREDPFGALSLAQAIVRDYQGPCRENHSHGFDRSFVFFALAELCLTLAHAARMMRKNRRRGEPDLTPLFRTVVAEISALPLDAPGAEAIGLAANAAAYQKSVRAQCRKLLGESEDDHAS